MLKCQKSKREGRTTALHKGIIGPVLMYGAELDSDKERGRATGEIRNEKAAVDTWRLSEG